MPLLRKLLFVFTITCKVSAFCPTSLSSKVRGGSSSSLWLCSRQPPPTTSLHRVPPKSPPPYPSSLSRRLPTATVLHASPSSSDDDLSCWNPDLRKRLAVISALGLSETAYLTYDKIRYSASGGETTSSLVGALCSASSDGAPSCGDVLHGPYASLHLGGWDVPLSALGAAAYAAVLLLAAVPLLDSGDDASGEGGGSAAVLDGNNRIALLGGTTLMASFSVFLVSLLLGVLHASCPFCFASAGLSISMAALSWSGGMLPDAEGGDESTSGEVSSEFRRKGLVAGGSSVGLAAVAALGLFLGAGDGADFDLMASSSPPAVAGTLLASAGPAKSYEENVSPRVTTKSSPASLALASDLKSLNARMFGAFWCSHCYDQKQSFGYEAMQSIPYVECDREGYNNNKALCKEREVPGYPTWEIGGKLFPGEQSLEELREIVDDVKSKM